MNFNGYEVIDYEVKKHKLRSAKLAPDGEIYNVFLFYNTFKFVLTRTENERVYIF